MGHLLRIEDRYRNTPETAAFCVRSSPLYMGEAFSRVGNLKSNNFNKLHDFLVKDPTSNFTDFQDMYKSESKYSPEDFARFMESVVRITALRIPEVLKDIWSKVRNVADIGGGSGYVLMELCKRYPNLNAINIDLPELEPVFNKYLERESTSKELNLRDRIHF
jgi:tRNA G46 methylase TrmB